ncbi:TPA: glycosyltransferase [Pseudomonas aeruginosa]|nr:glycosyltransferase [Pseudomonas aeruginosa]
MIEIRSLRDLLRLLFIYQREFKLAALSAVVIIVLGAFLLPAKYESNARLLVKPGRDSTLPIEISNRQALVMPSTQRDPIVDEERLLTGRPIVRQVAERYLEVLANRPPPEGLWKRTKFYVKKAIGAVFDGIRVTLETFGVIEETTAVERLAKDLEKKFEVTHAAGSTVMEISFTWSEPEVAQEVVKAWIEIYMEERTQALGRKSLYAFYEAQTADSAAQIKSYKAQILKHLNEIGASSIEDRLQDLSERINVLRGERFNSIRLIASSDSALESTRQQLKGLPREIVTVRQIALNPAQQDLRRLLNQKRLERADMMRTYTDDAPPVKALDASIRALEKEVQDEGATVQSSEDRAPNTLTTHLERVLLDETSNNAALRTQLAEQEKQLAELEAQRREALDIEPTLARLQRELNATERNYALYVDSLSAELQRTATELLREPWDVVQVEHSYSFQPYERPLRDAGQPFVLTEHNVESSLGAATYDRLPGWALPFVRYDQWRYRRWERRVMSQAAAVVAVTEKDARQLGAMLGRPVPVVVNGVDCEHFAAARPTPEAQRVLFLGNYEYAPNVDAVEWMLDEILPRVWAHCPEARMSVCGYALPAEWAQRWSDPRIEWQGFVPDLLQLQSSSSVFLAALRHGGGSKLKVLEALAAGLPLASTAQGVSGLELRDGEDYLGGESAEQLANAVVRLLQDPAQARALGENGRAYVRRAHDWSVAASQLEQVYAGLAEGAPACA